MPNIKKVSDIKSALLRPALTSNFEVKIAIPAELQSFVGTEQDNLNLSCSDASLPGSSIATMESLNDHTGVTERLAHRKMYDERIDFTFYVDANKYFPIRFFEKWMRYVTDEDNLADTQRGTRAGIDRTSPSYHYRMRYPDGTNGYRVDGVQVIKFERDHKQSLTYTFVKAYPVAVNSMPVSYDSSNLLKCTVSMSYIRYFIGDLSGAPTDTPTVSTNPQKPDVKPSPEVPEPLKKSSEVIQNTGPQGEGLYDSATGERLLSTEEQIINDGQVGDKLSPSLAAQLGT
jgi:hypothetical protein